MLFLTHMLNQPVVDSAGVRLGWVEDLVLLEHNLFPKVDALVLARRGQGALFLPWSSIVRIDHVIHLSTKRDALQTTQLAEDALFLRRDILDKQVVDINGRKVVRVNDLQLAPVNEELRLIGADIGMRGLLRRLNIEGPVSAMAKSINAQLVERVIPWNYVEGLDTDWPSLRLNISQRRLGNLPPTDIADIIAQLHPQDRDELLLHFDDETLADTLPHLEEDVQADLIEAMTDQRASDIMEILPPDEAADVLGDLPEERAERILGLMEPDDAEDVRELLRYDDDTAGGRMTPEYLALADNLNVQEALAELRRQAPDAETVYYVYVVDREGRLDGVLSLRDLITAANDTVLSSLVTRNVITVHVHDDQESVARILNHYHLLAVPVVDDQHTLLGIVTVDDVLDVLHEEAEEDISRQVGAIEESVTLATPWEQAWLRLPWVVGAGVTAMLLGIFLLTRQRDGDTQLNWLLALLPLLVLLGIHIGGQGASAMQVALAEGEDLRDILYDLLYKRWMVGSLLSLIGAGAISAVLHTMVSSPLALAIGGVLWLTLILTMVIGSLLPLVLHRFRWDPAFISRPALAVLAIVIGVPLLAIVL